MRTHYVPNKCSIASCLSVCSNRKQPYMGTYCIFVSQTKTFLFYSEEIQLVMVSLFWLVSTLSNLASQTIMNMDKEPAMNPTTMVSAARFVCSAQTFVPCYCSSPSFPSIIYLLKPEKHRKAQEMSHWLDHWEVIWMPFREKAPKYISIVNSFSDFSFLFGFISNFKSFKKKISSLKPSRRTSSIKM